MNAAANIPVDRAKKLGIDLVADYNLGTITLKYQDGRQLQRCLVLATREQVDDFLDIAENIAWAAYEGRAPG